MFSSGQGNLIRSSLFRNASPSNLQSLSLNVMRITRSIRQDQTWRNKKFMSNPSVSASVSYNDKRKSQDWHYRTHDTDLLNPDEDKFDYKKECL